LLAFGRSRRFMQKTLIGDLIVLEQVILSSVTSYYFCWMGRLGFAAANSALCEISVSRENQFRMSRFLAIW
jgi:hypothetical protein